MFRLFSGLRIRACLSGAFLMVALLGGAVGAFGVWGLARINDMNTELYDVELRGLSEMKDANLQLVYAGRARNSYLAASTEREREAIRQQFDTAVRNMDALRDRAHTYFHTDEGRRLLGLFKQMEDAWKRDAEAFFTAASAVPLVQKDPRAAESEKQVIASSELLDGLMSKLARNKEHTTAQSVRQGSELYRRTRGIMIALSIAGGAAGDAARLADDARHRRAARSGGARRAPGRRRRPHGRHPCRHPRRDRRPDGRPQGHE